MVPLAAEHMLTDATRSCLRVQAMRDMPHARFDCVVHKLNKDAPTAEECSKTCALMSSSRTDRRMTCLVEWLGGEEDEDEPDEDEPDEDEPDEEDMAFIAGDDESLSEAESSDEDNLPGGKVRLPTEVKTLTMGQLRAVLRLTKVGCILPPKMGSAVVLRAVTAPTGAATLVVVSPPSL